MSGCNHSKLRGHGYTNSTSPAVSMDAEVQRYTTQWLTTSAAIDAEEWRQRRDYHVDAIKYALTGKHSGVACGRYETVITNGCDKPAGHAGFCGGVLMHDYCACGRTMPTTAQYCKKCEPKPPTLREWLGDRVGELGRWAEVLRDQPVPAGWITRWEWANDPYREASDWLLHGFGADGAVALHLRANNFRTQAVGKGNAYLEAVQMAVFTHHPDVKPEPRPAAFPWNPYPEVV